MWRRTIRQAIKERASNTGSQSSTGGMAGIRLGRTVIEPSAVLKGAALEPAARTWFLKQLPRRAATPGEATALSPLLDHLMQLEEDREVERAVREFLERPGLKS